MDKTEAIKILTEHNKWRRAVKPYDKVGVTPPYTPADIGKAIDFAISQLQKPYTKEDISEIIDLYEYNQYRQGNVIEYVTQRMNENP